MRDTPCHIWSSNNTSNTEFDSSASTSDGTTTNNVRMWSTAYTESSLNASSTSSSSSELGAGALQLSYLAPFATNKPLVTPHQQPGQSRPGRLENLAQALENEFTLGFSTTDLPNPPSRRRDQPSPWGNSKLSSQPSSTFSAPECKSDRRATRLYQSEHN
jgi:hypothetical protein